MPHFQEKGQRAKCWGNAGTLGLGLTVRRQEGLTCLRCTGPRQNVTLLGARRAARGRRLCAPAACAKRLPHPRVRAVCWPACLRVVLASRQNQLQSARGAGSTCCHARGVTSRRAEPGALVMDCCAHSSEAYGVWRTASFMRKRLTLPSTQCAAQAHADARAVVEACATRIRRGGRRCRGARGACGGAFPRRCRAGLFPVVIAAVVRRRCLWRSTPRPRRRRRRRALARLTARACRHGGAVPCRGARRWPRYCLPPRVHSLAQRSHTCTRRRRRGASTPPTISWRSSPRCLMTWHCSKVATCQNRMWRNSDSMLAPPRVPRSALQYCLPRWSWYVAMPGRAPYLQLLSQRCGLWRRLYSTWPAVAASTQLAEFRRRIHHTANCLSTDSLALLDFIQR